MRLEQDGPMTSLRAGTSQIRIAAIGAASAFFLLSAGCMATRIKTSAELARLSEPLSAYPPNPSLRLLVLGDSTAVGTGASAPSGSIAGLIARDHPDWAIENRAEDGAKFAAIAAQAEAGGRFDVVLVMGGGNDVIRFTGEATLRQGVRRTLDAARALAPRVIVMPSGNVGNAPFFSRPWSWWMTARSRTLHAIVRGAAAATGAQFVDLYKDRADDPFAQDPRRLNAADGLHPSDAGYAAWYRELQAQAKL
jgi:lysophospholipase L1-like esterase